MSIRHLLEYDAPPPLWRMYARVLASRKPLLAGEATSVPRIEAALRAVNVDPQHLARYRRLVGAQPGEFLPIAYPHVLANSLHLATLSSGAFPVRLLGLVQLRNAIEQRRPIGADETLELRCGIEGHRVSKLGQEFDLESVVLVAGAQVWHETTTFLARRDVGAGRAQLRLAVDAPAVERFGRHRSTGLRAEAGVGRGYAWVSGDFNPIHLSAPTARMFGFRGTIAHGMWSLARCASEIGANELAGPAALEVSFRLPIRLPSSLTLQSSAGEGGCEFTLRDPQGERCYLEGRLRTGT